MTDYLERLLAEQETEEGREKNGGAFPDWGEPIFPAGRRRRAGAPGETPAADGGIPEIGSSRADRGAGGPAAYAAEEADLRGTSLGEAAGEQGGSGWAFADLSAPVKTAGDPAGTEAAGAGGAAGLYRRLVRTGAAAERTARAGSGNTVRAETASGPAGGWPGAEPGGMAPAFGPEELDRAFQRDARRYDGGFPLY